VSAGFPRILTAVCAVGAGISAGVFFAFSTFIMRALNRTPTPVAVTAMQAINVAAPNPLFMTALLGTGAGCGVLIVLAIIDWGEPAAVWVVVGAALYLVSIVLTITYHVPRNDALALVDPAGPTAAEQWRHFVSGWVPWNHVRTLTSAAGAALLVVALLRPRA
jgi:uncharacterized membrane protein